MSKEINWEEISMNLITISGSAKSDAMEALFATKDGDYELSKKKMQSAEDNMAKAHGAHFEVIAKEASGAQLDFKVLFMHAEDQLLTTQTLMLLIKELIEIHEKIDKI